tara:strand:+ start:68 stop:256 length:189 start_codon:yes stop_codon:yes gene_type:complete
MVFHELENYIFRDSIYFYYLKWKKSLLDKCGIWAFFIIKLIVLGSDIIENKKYKSLFALFIT